MAFTGRLGSSDSRLGNIVLGLGSQKRNFFRRSTAAPVYRAQVIAFADTVTYGYGDLIAEFQNAKNIGYADYLNDVPEAFVTINQDDPKLAAVLGHEGKCHLRLLRNDEVVFNGWFGLEHDANQDDVVLYSYGYLAGLFWTPTAWDERFVTQELGDIASSLWTTAKTGTANSLLGFVGTGQIQSPPTVKGGIVPITLPDYRNYWKRILFALRELAALGASDTGNTTYFEITNSETPKFNFWADQGVNTDVVWEYGGHFVTDFRELYTPVFRRNKINAAGSTARDVTLRDVESDAADIVTWGARTEPIYLAWVRDAQELDRINKLRLRTATRDDRLISLSFQPGRIVPPGTAESKARKGDNVRIKIARGLTQMNEMRRITGYQVLFIDGVEHVRIDTQEVPV